MKKIFVCILVMAVIINLGGCVVVESVKEVASPIQTPPPLKDTEIIVSEPIVETVVESVEEKEPEQTPAPTPEVKETPTLEPEAKLDASEIFEKRSEDLYIECTSQFGADSTQVDAYLSGQNINAVIYNGETPVNAIINENSDYVYIYMDNSFFGAKVTGFEKYNPMKYEDIVLQNASMIEDLVVDENGVNGYSAVRGMFEYQNEDYVIWYSEEYDIALRVEINQKVVYEIYEVKRITNIDMRLFEKPKGKMFVDFGDVSELSEQELMGLFG